jgi:hypothetical protein
MEAGTVSTQTVLAGIQGFSGMDARHVHAGMTFMSKFCHSFQTIPTRELFPRYPIIRKSDRAIFT